MKVLMTGNEAVARGAYEAGCKVATAYPGTPSTEILENIAMMYPEIDASWSPNEKVALEVAYGAAVAGVRAMACMKHVGVNVAADPLFTAVYTGSTKGLVLIHADDPAMHSSQNEQDNRHYAKFAKCPLLEPSNQDEARLFTKLAFEISEQFDTPVLVRMTTRICHTHGHVNVEEPIKIQYKLDFKNDPAKYVMVPGYARGRHVIVEKRQPALKEYSNNFPHHQMIWNGKTGIITSGVEFNYALEAFPEYSFLKISMVYPLPDKIIQDFASKMEKLYVVESLDPYLEEQILAMGIPVEGKKYMPITGELSVDLVRHRLNNEHYQEPVPKAIASRPPSLCQGCPHARVFELLGELDCIVTGDIGCYTLGALPPYNALHTCLCMGASIGHASGFEKVKKIVGSDKPVFSVIGDSTFIHSGITGLIEAVYNRTPINLIILNNFTTAMTGHQANPGSGFNLKGEVTHQMDFEELAKACGVEHVRTIDIFKKNEDHKKVFEEALQYKGVSVIIVESPCILDKNRRAWLRSQKEKMETE